MNSRTSARVEKRQEKQRQAMGFGSAVSRGLTIDPQYAIVISLIYVGVVIILHMIGKFKKEAPATAN